MHLPFVNRLFIALYFKNNLKGSDSALISFLNQVAHGIDHLISRGRQPYSHSLLTCAAIIGELKRRRIPLTDDINWALNVYAIALNRLAPNYSRSLGLANDHSCNTADLNPLSGTMVNRRSIRSWNSDPVDKRLLETVIDLAKWAPSSCNRQTVRILILDEDADKQFVAASFPHHNQFWTAAPLVLIVLVDSGSYLANQKHYMYMDGGAFIQNMLLLFHAGGLGACWVGMHHIHLETNTSASEDFRRHFNLPADYLPISLIPVGVPAIRPRAPKRKSLNEIIMEVKSA